jgi:hypothetical protein
MVIASGVAVQFNFLKGLTMKIAVNHNSKILAYLLLTAISVSPMQVAAAENNPLATSAQKEIEDQALRVLASPVVQVQREAVKQAFQAEREEQTQEKRATLPAAVDEVVFSGVVGVLNADPAHPRVQWLWSPAHTWFGLNVPAAKYLMPNVDNVFRLIPVDGVSQFEISAKPSGPQAPRQFTIQLISAIPGDDGSERVFSVLLDTDIQAKPDGSFTLTVGPEAASGRANHIQTVPEAHFLLIRDTIADWGNETPYHLEVRRLGDVAAATPVSDDILAERAASLVQKETPRIVQSKANLFFHQPANTVAPPFVREGGRWGLSAGGHFQLADDEALVLTLDALGGKYLAVQLANSWLGSLDYIHHSASLNIAQSTPNPDGSYTFVIAPHDPGVRNWLDTTGLHEGSIFIRWQKLPQPLNPAGNAVREVKVVKLSNLATIFPANTQKITPKERNKLLLERAAAYQKRFSEQ